MFIISANGVGRLRQEVHKLEAKLLSGKAQPIGSKRHPILMGGKGCPHPDGSPSYPSLVLPPKVDITKI